MNTQFKVGDIVERTNDTMYNLTKTSDILKSHFSGKVTASTLEQSSECKVIYTDDTGVLLEYAQGKNYEFKLGYLYYCNKYLTLIKRSEEVVNDYQIY